MLVPGAAATFVETFPPSFNMATAPPLETGALDNPRVQAIRAYQAAMARGDYARGAAVFAPTVRYSVPGHNALSGEYNGPQAVMGYLGRVMALTGGTYRIEAMHWLANDRDQVALFTVNHAERAGRAFTWEETLVFQFEDGRKVWIEHFQADQAGADAFYGPAR